MSKRRGAPFKNAKFTVRESSILQRKDQYRPLPRNSYLLQCVVETLLHRIDQLDKSKVKHKAKEARALLWLMARHEARLVAPSPELFLLESIPESFLEFMGSSSESEVVSERVEQDIEIGQTLVANATIQRQLRRLKGGRGAHEHLPETLTIQSKMVIDYFQRYPLPTYQKTIEEAFTLMQVWIDKHLPMLMSKLKCIPCLCDYDDSKPIELPGPSSIVHAEGRGKSRTTEFRYRCLDSDILLLLLSHLHQSQNRQSKPSQIGKLLKFFRTSS